MSSNEFCCFTFSEISRAFPDKTSYSTVIEETESLIIRSVVDATRLDARLRSGEGIGWLAAGIIPNSLYRVPFFYLLYRVPLSFVVSVSFRYVFFCSRWSFVDVPLIFFCPADHVQYRISNHVYYWVWLRPDRLM